MSDRSKKLILQFREIRNKDVGLVGGKNASLGEMVSDLAKEGVSVPDGFAVTSAAYFHFVAANQLGDRIREALAGLDIDDVDSLQERGARVRHMILQGTFPADLESGIREAYDKMCSSVGAGKTVAVAVRSSATAEDLPDASFAGQQETFLNISGADNVLAAAKRCMASLFTNRAISYRVAKKFNHFDIGLSVGVQIMVQSECSGVCFTLDTESGFSDVVLLSGAFGLGENVVQGAVNPDEWLVHKPTLKAGYRSILKQSLGSKELTMVYAEDNSAGNSVKNLRTPYNNQIRFCLSDDEVLTLARWACVIEDHYKRAMDIEWAKDKSGNLFIVQARPETVFGSRSQEMTQKLSSYCLDAKETPAILASGSAVGSKIGSGKASVILSISEMSTFQNGDVLVAEQTDPDWEPILKRASAVVTNRGGRTCHAAIISRELGIPCLVGCGDATLHIQNGSPITVDTSAGELGHVYAGEIPFHISEVDLAEIPSTKTKVALLLGNPALAFSHSFLPNDGCGLARMEFLVSSWIKAHPKALLHPELLSATDRKEIQTVIGPGTPSNWTAETGRAHFVSRLSAGIAILAAAFYPKPCILRFSDFKTDEYAGLLGGKQFEPEEDNPMLGWRGASRYYDDKYAEAFALECEAVKKVRETMGLTNLEVMIPFVRTVAELRDVLKEMEKHGLVRGGDKGLRVIMMCEIPANCVLAKEFLSHIDGFSIGSNDLTQLTLGIDRNSAQISHLYDERNDAVKALIRMAIKEAKATGKYIGICGQGPSDHPDFAEFLVREGIGSISVQPDVLLKTRVAVANVEKEIAGN